MAKVIGVFLLFALLIPFSMALIFQRDLTSEVDAAYLNGLITACGIFVAFLFSSVVAKVDCLGSKVRYLVTLTLLLFISSITLFAYTLIAYGYGTFLNISFFTSTLLFAIFTAWEIINTLFKKK